MLGGHLLAAEGMVALHALGLKDVSQFIVDSIEVTLCQHVVGIESETDGATCGAALDLDHTDIGNAGQILCLQADCIKRTRDIGLVLELVERHGEVVVNVHLLIVTLATRHNLVSGIRLVGIVFKGHILLEVEAYAQADILALIRLIEEDVVIPGSLVDLLLLPVGDAVAFLLQRLHPCLQFLAGHTLVIDAIKVRVFLAREFGAHDMSLGGNLRVAVLVVDGCRPLAVGQARGVAALRFTT